MFGKYFTRWCGAKKSVSIIIFFLKHFITIKTFVLTVLLILCIGKGMTILME